MNLVRICVVLGLLLCVVACAPNTVVNPAPIATFEQSATFGVLKRIILSELGIRSILSSCIILN